MRREDNDVHDALPTYQRRLHSAPLHKINCIPSAMITYPGLYDSNMFCHSRFATRGAAIASDTPWLAEFAMCLLATET